MLHSVDNLEGFTIGATDGEIGKVHSFLFDGLNWTIRYLVVDTGKWLPGRKVLITPGALGRADWQGRTLHVNLTRDQVKSSPDIDTDKPVSRQWEAGLHRHYGWTPYWGLGYGIPGAPPAHLEPDRRTTVLESEQVDPNLHSTREVKGYRIHATDGEIGHVDDFIISEEDWVVRYLIVDTRNWLPGRSVLVSPEWVADISWEDQAVWVDASRQAIKGSPPYDPSTPINREYETQMYDYYGRPRYWE